MHAERTTNRREQRPSVTYACAGTLVVFGLVLAIINLFESFMY